MLPCVLYKLLILGQGSFMNLISEGIVAELVAVLVISDGEVVHLRCIAAFHRSVGTDISPFTTLLLDKRCLTLPLANNLAFRVLLDLLFEPTIVASLIPVVDAQKFIPRRPLLIRLTRDYREALIKSKAL
jgi:hypothetical protein